MYVMIKLSGFQGRVSRQGEGGRQGECDRVRQVQGKGRREGRQRSR